MTMKLSFILSRLKSPGLKTVPVRFRLAAPENPVFLTKYGVFPVSLI